MMQFQNEAKGFIDPEEMAAAYLVRYDGNQKIEYPINPFRMLKAEGALFSLRNFKKLEGVYIPAAGEDDIPMVGININRPITRQRFTAAHELCHHFRDADREVSCPINGKKNSIEDFAEKFAAALLMPINELRHQVNKRQKNGRRYISFDDVLVIADFFGERIKKLSRCFCSDVRAFYIREMILLIASVFAVQDRHGIFTKPGKSQFYIPGLKIGDHTGFDETVWRYGLNWLLVQFRISRTRAISPALD